MTVHVGRVPEILYQPVLQRDHLIVVGQRFAAELEHELVAHITCLLAMGALRCASLALAISKMSAYLKLIEEAAFGKHTPIPGWERFAHKGPQGLLLRAIDALALLAWAAVLTGSIFASLRLYQQHPAQSPTPPRAAQPTTPGTQPPLNSPPPPPSPSTPTHSPAK